MERREQYEPEDIEALLHERGFDELLAEERAFVLRHLSGREEYEGMRALLHRARNEERTLQPLTPDPAIREQLLTTFRERQVPVWRIWLNSVKAFVFPEQASAFWRPALAVAGVLVLVLAGVRVARLVSEGGQVELAAVHEDPAKDPNATIVTEAGTAEHAKDVATPATVTDQPERKVEATQERSIGANGLAELKEKLAPPPHLAGQPVLRDEAGYAATEDLRIAETDIAADTTNDLAAMNYVEKEALLENQSLANATGAVAREEVVAGVSRTGDRSRRKTEVGGEAMANSRSMKEDEKLIGLLNAAW